MKSQPAALQMTTTSLLKAPTCFAEVKDMFEPDDVDRMITRGGFGVTKVNEPVSIFA